MNIKHTQSEIDANERGAIYVEQGNIKVWQGNDTIRVTDLTNALARGKTCKEVAVSGWNKPCGALNCVNGRYAELLAEHAADTEIDGLQVYVTEADGKRTFSPFATGRILPLKSIPKKWTVPNAIRALLNGQYRDLRCNGVYTDDYAYDNAVNYKRGVIADAVAFCVDIIERPSGWWVSERDGKVSICCHSFDSNEFAIAL